MIIDDESEAKSILTTCSYYRLTGYALQYRLAPTDSNYRQGTDFHTIIKLIEFDARLRGVLLGYLEQAEVYYRTQVSYGFAIMKCTAPPYDQHYDRNNYHNKDSFDDVMADFQKQKGYYKDSLIMKHHKKKYSGKMPLWVIVEMLSFSDLSKLYSSMYISEQDAIAQSVGTGRDVLKNHLHCLSVLRNKCAHSARLYNTVFNPPVKLPDTFLRTFKTVKNDTLFSYILALIKRLPDDKSKLAMIDDVDKVIQEYAAYLDCSLIGFPERYKDILVLNRG